MTRLWLIHLGPVGLPSLVPDPGPRGLTSRSTLVSLGIHAALVGAAVLISTQVAVRRDRRRVKLTFYDTPTAEAPAGGGAAAPSPASPAAPAPRPRRVLPRKTIEAPAPPAPLREPSPYDTPYVPPSPCTGPDCAGTPGGTGTGPGTGTGTGTGNGPGNGTGTGNGPPTRAQPIYMTPGMSRPRLVRGEQPQYTAQARRARVEGDLTVRIEIGEDGRVRDARILRGLALLDAEVLRVIRTWRFTPPMHGGHPVSLYLIQTISFHLED